MKHSFKDYAAVIDRFRETTILHIGDFVLDQFEFGEISRISREAPVLILKYRETIRIPGGGANAVNNLLSLGAKVIPVGVLGEDEAGDWLYQFFRNSGVDVSCLFRRTPYMTPVKTRVLAGSFHSSMQQMLRIDREEIPPTPVVRAEEVIARVEALLPHVQGMVVSDYGYGLVQPEVVKALQGMGRARGIPVVVDSRFSMRDFKSVTSLTPNISEVEAAYQAHIGEDLTLMDRAARRILEEQDLEALLITRGRLGMSLYRQAEKPVHISVFGSGEVADVTGAGDTVISVYTLALACGAPFEMAARMSNYAGGLVVMKRGTATASAKELVSAIKADLAGKKV